MAARAATRSEILAGFIGGKKSLETKGATGKSRGNSVKMAGECCESG